MFILRTLNWPKPFSKQRKETEIERSERCHSAVHAGEQLCTGGDHFWNTALGKVFSRRFRKQNFAACRLHVVVKNVGCSWQNPFAVSLSDRCFMKARGTGAARPYFVFA
nr:MAG TPA: hypothetical protein [Caudoviricetes sp.]